MCCDAGMDFDSYARRLWAGRADAYEHGFARLTVHAVGALLDAAGVGTGTRVLDVGTGPGVVAGAAVARGARVTAVDAEPSMAEAAARNVPGLDVRVAVLPDLPLPAAGFDAVTGNFVIHATGDPAAVLAELRRVLRAGGRGVLAAGYPGPAVPSLQLTQYVRGLAGRGRLYRDRSSGADLGVSGRPPGVVAGLSVQCGFQRRRDRTAGRRHDRAHQGRVRQPGRPVRDRRRRGCPARQRRARQRDPPLGGSQTPLGEGCGHLAVLR